ncbi:hypothetical protein [Halothiobacillus neapolitanus]|uniref:Uncharacterized protein n=1 Tax=Halothiobacillus neapolitanus (strain ATCC 23641 / DSM 15147 / CIP 104769 / NCIMB 8539 / c2) TaxID=555778 RepID=D0KY00_HALNC|nr:hypothetical protein [Halothiobacillus neapolitanus]ACX95323.1 hypothetical protein Hneap_0467 [Halothiobacillus neapolitanus c2]OZB73067.1 MAG: hypothetical protein B7X37_09180 [Halothiobacillus sp. 14-55-98]TDN58309.1 hypothetical protein C8D83_10833 [Halothiobacillus neapolitanus]
MDWIKILSAVFIVAMLVFLWPRAGQMIRESRKGTINEWLWVGLLLLAVAAFVVFLMQSMHSTVV